MIEAPVAASARSAGGSSLRRPGHVDAQVALRGLEPDGHRPGAVGAHVGQHAVEDLLDRSGGDGELTAGLDPGPHLAPVGELSGSTGG